jgi:hypothetical protein
LRIAWLNSFPQFIAFSTFSSKLARLDAFLTVAMYAKPYLKGQRTSRPGPVATSSEAMADRDRVPRSFARTGGVLRHRSMPAGVRAEEKAPHVAKSAGRRGRGVGGVYTSDAERMSRTCSGLIVLNKTDRAWLLLCS